MRRYFELAAWVISIVLLATMDPHLDAHFSFCLFHFVGIPFCPGCGLGHSISFLFRGELHNSFSAHPLGLFAVLVILFRVYQLIFLHIFTTSKLKQHGIRQ